MNAVQAPTLAEIENARTALKDVTCETPLIPFPGDVDLYLKMEIHQPAGSFKIRGVYHAVSRFSDEQRSRGLSTVSAGNTAKALAWCGKEFGVPARSLMPDHAPQPKIDAVKGYGAEPVLVPMDQVFAYMKGHGWESEPYAFVHPWTDRNVMIGHGTMGLEIVEQLPEVDTVFLPVGGGGLMGGVGTAIKLARPQTRIVAVEPLGCPSFHDSVQAGLPVSVECDTMCDGVAVPYMTEEMFPILRELADDTMLITEDEVRETIRLLALKSHIIAEGAGALATAAALKIPQERRGKSVAVVTGGSIDLTVLAGILATPIRDGTD